jgi:hypothetical protein
MSLTPMEYLATTAQAGNLIRQDKQDLTDIQEIGLVGLLENQIFRNQEFITKRGNLKNTKN